MWIRETSIGYPKVVGEDIFDVAIIGGGINGAALYHQLCNEGYRVLLVDKGDFACGTSQASAMMAAMEYDPPEARAPT